MMRELGAREAGCPDATGRWGRALRPLDPKSLVVGERFSDRDAPSRFSVAVASGEALAEARARTEWRILVWF